MTENDMAGRPLPTDPTELAELARIGQMALRAAKARDAEIGHAKPRKRTRPIGPTQQDVKAVTSRLSHMGWAAQAIHRIARAAVVMDTDDKDAALVLIQETARSIARALDACGQRLGDTPVGCFQDEMVETD